MLDIVSDIAILLGAPKVILPFTLFLFVTLCQAILMYMKNKKDTMWMLKWTDDICFVNLQWLFSLFISLAIAPVVVAIIVGNIVKLIYRIIGKAQ